MTQLSQAEQATNYQTYKHINRLMQWLATMQLQITKRMFTHDRSKLAPPEVDTFTKYTSKLKDLEYGSAEYKRQLEEMKPALDHHYAHNRHHPEFFPNGINDMNIIDVLEMLCDWQAASERHSTGDLGKSIAINQERFQMSDQLTNIFLNSIELFEKDMFRDLITQQDI